jgi:hypothetical protein
MDANVKWLASRFPSDEVTPSRNPLQGGFDNGDGMCVTALAVLTIYFAYAT